MWLSAPPKSTIDLACAAESANFTLLFIEPPLGSLLGGASANSRALTFTCRSHPITVIGTPINHSDRHSDWHSDNSLASGGAAAVGTGVAACSRPRPSDFLQARAERWLATREAPLAWSRPTSGCTAHPRRRRAGAGGGPTARGAPRPSRARSLTPGSAPQPSLSGGARRPVVEQALLRAHFTKSLRCWRGLCARLGDGLRREGSNHERRRRQRRQEGQESHLALLDR